LLAVPTNGPQAANGPKLRRSQSRAFMSEDGMPQPIEFFVASDASAVIEHTKRVLYLEDDDIAHIAEGGECARLYGWSLSDLQNSTSTVSAAMMVYLPYEPSNTSRSSCTRS
jgi:hypothetical protein